MKGLAPLLKKEIKEQVRTYKLAIVGGIFVFFGITTPIMLKYLPEILRLAGEDIAIEFPPPTALQALGEYASTIGQVGLLVAVLIIMGSVANELRQGTAIMTLSKPVSRAAFTSAKFLAACLTFAVSLAAGSAFAFVYTVLLIEGVDLAAFAALNLLLAVFLFFCLAVTLLFSSLFKSSLAAGGIAIAVLITQAIGSALPLVGDYMPGRLLSWGTALLAGPGETYWWALAVTLAVIGLCLYASQRSLKNRDL